MEIFKGRPLCVIITVCLIIIAGCAFAPAAIGLMIPAVAAGFLIIIIILALTGKFRADVAAIIAVACVLIAVSGLRGHAYFNKGRSAFEPYYEYSEVTADLTVSEIVYYNRYGTTVKVRVNSIYGNEINAYALLECDYELGLEVGDNFLLPISVFPLSKLVEEGIYSETSALSYGYLAYLRSYTDNGIYVAHKNGFFDKLYELNESLCADLVYYLGDRAGGLASALALGNQRYVEDEVALDFRRTGLAHILALSGSHIILIIGTADVILRKFFLPKGLRSALLFLSVPLYVIFVMTPIPALRAGIMYMLFLLSFYFKDDSDAVTNLFLSVLIIVLLSPATVFSASLWMSFAATLLMVLLMPMISYILSVTRSKLKSKWMFDIARAIALSAVTAILGTGANVIFSYSLFGSISLVGIVTNVIFGPLLTALLAAYMLMLPFLYAPPIASAIAIPIRAASEFVLDWIKGFSMLKYSVISLKSEYAQVICIAVFAVTVAFLIMKVKRKMLVSVPIAALLICMAFYHVGFASDNTVNVTYVTRGMNEEAVIRRGDDFSIIDVSDGRYSSLRDAMNFAEDAGATELESVVLTHYHSYHSPGIRRLFDSCIVRYLVLPMPSDEDDREVLRKLLALCEEKGVEAVIIDEGARAQIVESVFYERILHSEIKRSAHPIVAYNLYIGENQLSYIGSSANESKELDELILSIEQSDKIVFGRHGPVPKLEYDMQMPIASEIYALNEDIYPFLSKISDKAPIITGKRIWMKFIP